MNPPSREATFLLSIPLSTLMRVTPSTLRTGALLLETRPARGPRGLEVRGLSEGGRGDGDGVFDLLEERDGTLGEGSLLPMPSPSVMTGAGAGGEAGVAFGACLGEGRSAGGCAIEEDEAVVAVILPLGLAESMGSEMG